MIKYAVSISEILVVVTLIIFVWEAYLLRNSIQANVWQDSVSKFVELDNMIIDKPELDRVFDKKYSPEKLKPFEKRFIINYITCFEQLYAQKNTMNKKKLKPWKNYMKNTMKLPAFRLVWKRHITKNEFLEDFREEIDELYNNLGR